MLERNDILNRLNLKLGAALRLYKFIKELQEKYVSIKRCLQQTLQLIDKTKCKIE